MTAKIRLKRDNDRETLNRFEFQPTSKDRKKLPRLSGRHLSPQIGDP